MESGKLRRAVLIDRDGTMGPMCNVEFPTQFKAFDNIREIVELFRNSGFLVLAVTNQSCIARGKDHGYDFAAEFQSYGLDGWFICPHDDGDGCNCRKPLPGLVLQAQKQYQLDLTQCIMIGDRWSDINAGKRCGCKAVLVLTGRGKEEQRKPNQYAPDFIAQDLEEAAKWVAAQN